MPATSQGDCIEDARGQIFELDSVALAEVNGLFNRVLQFIHVAGPAIIHEYLHGWPYELYKLDRSEFVRQIMGCVLMGMSTALGSQFWHDFSKGLIDLRDRSKAVANLASAEAASRTSVPKLPPSEIPPAGFLTALSGIAGTVTRRVPPPTQPPA